jgi:four helix bundle protein
MPHKNPKDNIIVVQTFNFALAIVSFCELLEEKRKWTLSNQLFRSGTSIGANIREAQNAESKADFIHKFKIAAKECEETIYWLDICQNSVNLPNCDHLLELIKNIQNIINKIIISSKTK